MGNRIPHARFKSEEEILKAIEDKRAFVEKLKQRAENHVKRAHEIWDAIQEWPDGDDRIREASRGRAQKEKAERLFNRAESVQTRYISRLINKLAVFRTDQLPALDNNDRSIPK